MAVPNTFANATTTLPLVELDQNFATNITLGSTQFQLGSSVPSLTGLTNVSTSNLIVGGGTPISLINNDTFVPTDVSGAGLSLTVQRASYTQIGTRVWVEMTLTYPSTASGANAGIGMGSLPNSANVVGIAGMWIIYYGGANYFMGLMAPGTNAFNIYDSAENAQTNATLSGRGIRMQFNYSTV